MASGVPDIKRRGLKNECVTAGTTTFLRLVFSGFQVSGELEKNI
jgi:hypothetical protein